MPRKKRIISIMVCFLFLFASCTSSIKREGYVLDHSTVSQADCANTIIVRSLDYDPGLVVPLGKISASDSGFSVDCSEKFVIDSFKKDACAVGADIVNITKDSQPDFWSTCYRAEAELLRIKDREKLSNIKSDSRYSEQNVGHRSGYTECMNSGFIAATAFGGLVGALILNSVCKSKYAENGDENGKTSTLADEPASNDKKNE